MSSTENPHKDWFQRVSDSATGELPVKRIWIGADELSDYPSGRMVLHDDGDWRIEHVGPAIDRGWAGLQHPVYLKAICEQIEPPPALDFDGRPILAPTDSHRDHQTS